MEIIARVSKGTNMDQIYLPKNRHGFGVGNYVVICPLERRLEKKQAFKPYFYGLRGLEPLKLEIIKEIFKIVESARTENVIITGSFLDKGFRFNDVDIVIVGNEKINTALLQEKIEKDIGIRAHVISLSYETLISGLSTDPLYSLMLNKCVSKKRLIFKAKRKFDYKLLDYQLLKSKTLPNNFDVLTGDDKYYLTRNMLAILLFIQDKKLSREAVDRIIGRTFRIGITDLKNNLVNKAVFVKKYRRVYDGLFNEIMGRLHEPK